MKRTAATLMLLAGLGGGGCMTPQSQTQQAPKGQPTTQTGGFGTVTRGKQVNTVQGPLGEPVMAVRGAAPGSGGVMQAGGANMLVGKTGVVRPVSGYGPNVVTSNDGCASCSVPGLGGQVVRTSGYGPGFTPGMSGGFAGDPTAGGPQKLPIQGIIPVPFQGVPGAVAAVGAYAGGARPPLANGRSSINFTGPAGMKVTWQLPDGTFNDELAGLTAPKPYNFWQGQVYRLRLGSILPDFPGKFFYPTLEVTPASPKTLTFLAHSSVPITFAPDDFAQAAAGNLVVKVIYLPDPINQDFSTIIGVGAEEVVSTRLEPGADPVAEAQRRGTILAIIRMGNIDLENKISPAMTAPPPGFVPPGAPLPPPGVMPVPPKGNAMAPEMVPPIAPSMPTNAAGMASVKTPKPLPPVMPTDVPIAPISPQPPIAPKVKTK